MPEMPEPPVNRAAKMQGKGLSKREIADKFQDEGMSARETSEALNQADLPNQDFEFPQSSDMQPSAMENQQEMPESQLVPQSGFAPAETPQAIGGGIGREAEEFIQEVAESIINEKWEHVNEEFGDLSVWKERVSSDITSIKQEIMRVENRMDNLQNTIIGRIGEYDSHIAGVGTEIKALEEVLKNIMKPLTTNIKELSRITEDLKKDKKSKA